MKEVKVKKEKGITLVALVVTIVVLLILAGVSINLVVGENGLINKAKEAADATRQAAINDQIEINSLYDELAGQLGESSGGSGGTGGSGGSGEDDEIPYLPKGFSKVNGTSLSTGLVIQDGSGNQYVWIEVPKTAAVYPNAGLTITSFTDDEYRTIEEDLHTYTSTYRNGTDYTDTYKADSTTGWFSGESQYNEAKKKMLKSVYENGGFYVGRYETGIATTESPRTAKGDTTQTPVIKANAYPYNYVTRTQAKVLAENMAHGDRTTSLMFGVQWDLVLAYMHNVGKVDDSVLISNSKDIGNYKDNLWNITNTSAKWWSSSAGAWKNCPKDKNGSSASILLTTGADTSFGIKNIYDIAGNVWEWTLEETSSTDLPCAGRGGGCNYNGSSFPASYRSNSDTSGSSSYFGFRVSLY